MVPETRPATFSSLVIDQRLPLRYYPSLLGPASRGLALLLRSAEAREPVCEEEAVSDPVQEIADLLSRRGIATLVVTMPPTGTTQIEEIVERQKRILALFKFAHEQFAGMPLVAVACGDDARCLAALLKVRRATTDALQRVIVSLRMGPISQSFALPSGLRVPFFEELALGGDVNQELSGAQARADQQGALVAAIVEGIENGRAAVQPAV